MHTEVVGLDTLATLAKIHANRPPASPSMQTMFEVSSSMSAKDCSSTRENVHNHIVAEVIYLKVVQDAAATWVHRFGSANCFVLVLSRLPRTVLLLVFDCQFTPWISQMLAIVPIRGDEAALAMCGSKYLRNKFDS